MNEDPILTQVPSADLVRSVLDKYWTEGHEIYGHYWNESKALDSILMKKKENIDEDNILIKACLINSLYSTNIRSPKALYDIAANILEMKIDERLEKGDLTLVDSLVDSIAKVTQKRYYSFVTKYCSWHNPKAYPIFDSIVEDRLNHYFFKSGCNIEHSIPVMVKKGGKESKLDLRVYENHVAAINTFMKHFGLQCFEYKEIDWYLWITGRQLAPPKGKRKKKKESEQNAIQN